MKDIYLKSQQFIRDTSDSGHKYSPGKLLNKAVATTTSKRKKKYQNQSSCTILTRMSHFLRKKKIKRLAKKQSVTHTQVKEAMNRNHLF